jgi:putative transposase
MPFTPELLDELPKDYKKPDDLLGEQGLLQRLTKALVERALNGELTHHLGYGKHSAEGDNSGNPRDGTTPKSLGGKRGQVRIDVPRDRNAEFEPQLVKKNQTRLDGFDEKDYFPLCARGDAKRDSRAPGRDLRRRGLALSDLYSHRRGRVEGVARSH